MLTKRLFAAPLAVTLLGAAALLETHSLQPGQYAITYRLEMPHLERYAVERTTLHCVEPRAHLPVLGAKSTFDRCSRSEVTHSNGEIRYRLACKGRAGARAEAVHRLIEDGFTGRIAIVLGAKNMTMTEVQSARRVGDCL